MKKILSLSLLILATSFILPIQAQDSVLSKKKLSPKLGLRDDEKDWSIELGAGYLISDVRTDLPGYDLASSFIMASTSVDEVSLDNFAGGIFRGYTQFFFKGFGISVLHGTESRFVGIDLGPRYNFVQPGWKFVPFVEGNVGFAFTDSRGVTTTRGQIGQGQDFCFNFGITLGTTYEINDDWFLRFSGVYTHFSNSGLSEPVRKNRALDAAGPELSLGYRF